MVLIVGESDCVKKDCKHFSKITLRMCKHPDTRVCFRDGFKFHEKLRNSCEFCGKIPKAKKMNGVGDILFNSKLNPKVYICGNCAGAVVERCNAVEADYQKLVDKEKKATKGGHKKNWICDQVVCIYEKFGVCEMSISDAKYCRNNNLVHLTVDTDGKED